MSLQVASFLHGAAAMASHARSERVRSNFGEIQLKTRFSIMFWDFQASKILSRI